MYEVTSHHKAPQVLISQNLCLLVIEQGPSQCYVTLENVWGPVNIFDFTSFYVGEVLRVVTVIIIDQFFPEITNLTLLLL
jgi:hypothetical protein